jgi:hypothetical protein
VVGFVWLCWVLEVCNGLKVETNVLMDRRDA